MDKKDILMVAIIAVVASLAVSAFAPQIGMSPRGSDGIGPTPNSQIDADSCSGDENCYSKASSVGDGAYQDFDPGRTMGVYSWGEGSDLTENANAVIGIGEWTSSSAFMYSEREGNESFAGIAVEDGMVCAGENCLSSNFGKRYFLRADAGDDWQSEYLDGKNCFLTNTLYGNTTFNQGGEGVSGCRILANEPSGDMYLMATATGLTSGYIFCEATCLVDGVTNLRGSGLTVPW